ncbi:uncharacterized protein [Channa argus]|uniref:uncharacterized protein isoform X3 n=1 Tax=Channa argus TaxID=215402 RepID=UPI00352109F4
MLLRNPSTTANTEVPFETAERPNDFPTLGRKLETGAKEPILSKSRKTQQFEPLSPSAPIKAEELQSVFTGLSCSIMNLCLSSLFLVVGLFRSSSALTPEECRPLVTPLSLADPSMMFGRTNFIVGYTDHEVYKNILKVTDSSWLNMTASPSSPNELVMYHENRINGSCYASKFNITIDGNSAKSSYANVTSAFHLLPSCEGCVLLSINSTARDADNMLKLMNFISTEKEISAHALYLLARETTVKDLDLEHFKQQASCLGFSGEPDFYYDPKKDFCHEGDSTRIQFT